MCPKRNAANILYHVRCLTTTAPVHVAVQQLGVKTQIRYWSVLIQEASPSCRSYMGIGMRMGFGSSNQYAPILIPKYTCRKIMEAVCLPWRQRRCSTFRRVLRVVPVKPDVIAVSKRVVCGAELFSADQNSIGSGAGVSMSDLAESKVLKRKRASAPVGRPPSARCY